MATSDTTVTTQHEQAPISMETADQTAMTPFERLCSRLRETVVIHGDIVNSDPEDWDCQGE